jgi:hypothetical protein
MAWDKGRYYTRSRKVNGRVVREYIGRGRVAELAAQLDSANRERRHLERLALQHEKNELETIEADLKRLTETTDLLARAALLAAGYHRHKRGEWRKRRGQDNAA